MIGKMLGMAALGVGAVAAAPFTGGGSLLGAASIAASLTGAGTIAAATGAAAAGAAAGYAMSSSDEKEKERSQRQVAESNLKAQKAEKIVKAYEKPTKYILAVSAIGIAMAHSDTKISDEEKRELDEYLHVLSENQQPKHIIEEVKAMIAKPPTYNEAIKHLEKIDKKEYPKIREMLVAIMLADEMKDEEQAKKILEQIEKNPDELKIECFAKESEQGFLAAFDEKVTELSH